MKTIYIIITTIVLFSSCLENANVESEHHDHHGHDEHTESNTVTLTNKQLELMGVEIGTPSQQLISTGIQATGVLELPPQNKASLSSIADGRVKDIKVIEGALVRKGQTLAYIENIKFIEIQQEYLILKQKEERLKADVTRKNNLYKDSIVALKVVQKIEEEYESNHIKLVAVEAQLKLLGINVNLLNKGDIKSFIPIQSPINGYVRVIEVNMNSYVHPGDVLFEIVDNEHLHIDLMVFEKDVPFIRKDQRVTFSMAQFPNKIYEASVFAVGKALEEEQRAMRVHAELKEEYYSLLPGMYVDATIHSNDYEAATLPKDAFIEENGETYIYSLSNSKGKENFHFEKLKVKKGKENNGFVEVNLSKSLRKDLKVVTNGAYYIHAELNKESFEHSH